MKMDADEKSGSQAGPPECRPVSTPPRRHLVSGRRALRTGIEHALASSSRRLWGPPYRGGGQQVAVSRAAMNGACLLQWNRPRRIGLVLQSGAVRVSHFDIGQLGALADPPSGGRSIAFASVLRGAQHVYVALA